ncbi:Leucine-rich repeat-containing protein 58 [Candida viswanathii]|uniref:Leucine-rich repeat-containing protein 58 n=1 Tax=Candida viswanathii TaxID=5486 RepID=A0A367YAV5_9ASCO|nr:Leucine-rich repeat-containing protein 58 [Candida viswanathii]
MEKSNPLLPFAFSISANYDAIPLDTTPRDKTTIDENAGSLYHTRKTISPSPLKDKLKQKPGLRPTLGMKFPPRLKRKMGESFNDKDDVKRMDTRMEESQEDSQEESEEVVEDGEATLLDDGLEPVPLLPSSPPGPELFTDVNLVSEFDYTTNPETSYEIPKSPAKKVHHMNFPSELNDISFDSSPTKRKAKPQLSSEPDFGIDRFNRFNGNLTYELLSSTGVEENEQVSELAKQASYNRARSTILNAFEEPNTVINLEGLNLYEIPAEIKDMNNLVFICDDEPRAYHLFLTNNNLLHLPPALFKFTKLQVLSLRINRLTSIPPLIGKLQNVVDLSLGANSLRFLPFQILNMPNLDNFAAGPNPYKKLTDFPPKSIIEIKKTVGKHKLNYRTKIIALTEPTAVYLTSLKTQCLTKIAKHDVSYQETKAWKKHTPRLYHNLIKEAITKGKFHDVCYKCDNIVVEPIAQVYEWWDILLNKNVPIRKQFCSQKCVDGYEWEVECIVKMED